MLQICTYLQNFCNVICCRLLKVLLQLLNDTLTEIREFAAKIVSAVVSDASTEVSVSRCCSATVSRCKL